MKMNTTTLVSRNVVLSSVREPLAPLPTTARFVSPLSKGEAVNQARILKALADPTRLRILSLLSRYEGQVCVFEIVENLTLEQPTISHHLRILRNTGLVDCRKKGLWVYYSVHHSALIRAQEIIGQISLLARST